MHFFLKGRGFNELGKGKVYLSILFLLLVPILQWHIENLKRSQRKPTEQIKAFRVRSLRNLLRLSRGRLRADLIAVYEWLHIQKVSEIRVTFNSQHN